MLEQLQNQGPKLQEVEAARVAAEAARATAESNFQPLAESEPALQSDIVPLTRLVQQLGDERARTRQ